MVRTNTSCQSQLQLGCLCNPVCVYVARVKRSGNDNVGLWQVLVKIAVCALLGVCQQTQERQVGTNWGGEPITKAGNAAAWIGAFGGLAAYL